MTASAAFVSILRLGQVESGCPEQPEKTGWFAKGSAVWMRSVTAYLGATTYSRTRFRRIWPCRTCWHSITYWRN